MKILLAIFLALVTNGVCAVAPPQMIIDSNNLSIAIAHQTAESARVQSSYVLGRETALEDTIHSLEFAMAILLLGLLLALGLICRLYERISKLYLQGVAQEVYKSLTEEPPLKGPFIESPEPPEKK